MSDVAPIASGAPVGSLPRGVVPKHTMQPRKVELGVLSAHEQNLADLFRDAENAVVAAGQAEQQRDALYATADEALAAKYGVSHE